VTLKGRAGLQQLLTDVLSGHACFDVILVYDVSRWGRFQDDNEAAHYEFLCRRSGVSVHYCAEPFANDGTMAATLLKSLKRIMAKEYSRELSVKTYAGQARLAKLGFKIQGTPGFGLRRMVFSHDGKQKQMLKTGEYKSLKNDRVKLVPGPKREVECVRRMYKMALDGMGCSDIAHALNLENIVRDNGKPWSCDVVRTILTHPKYAGCNVWGRTSQKFRHGCSPVPRECWVVRPGSFSSVVDVDTFGRVQQSLRKYAGDLHWSDDEIMAKLRSLVKTRGKLSESLIDGTRGMPTYSTVQRRFGSLGRAYKLIGYNPKSDYAAALLRKRQMGQLWRALVEDIRKRFPLTTLFRQPGKIKSLLRLNSTTELCVKVCVSRQVPGKMQWDFRATLAERTVCTLLATSNAKGNGFHSMFLMPPRKWKTFYRFDNNPKWLGEGIRVKNISQLFDVIAQLKEKSRTCTQVTSFEQPRNSS